MQRIPILHVIPKLVVGGVQTQLQLVLRNYDRSRYSVTVCTLYDIGDIGREMEESGIEVVCLQKPKDRFDWTIIRDLYRLIKEKNIKIVRTHRYNANLYGRVAALLAGVPCIIASVHNIYQRDRKLNRRIVNHLLSRLTDKVVAVSETVKRDIVRYDAVPDGKVQVIYNGIDMSRFSAADGSTVRKEFGLSAACRVIGTVGRFTDQKGHRYLVEAAAEVMERHPDVVLLMVGDGALKGELTASAERLHIADRVIFAGWRRDIPALLDAMDIFAFPSHWEGLPNAVIEAMAMGKPIIASDILPVREVIASEQDGILVPPGDSHALAGAIASLLADRVYAANMGSHVRERARANFSIDATVGAYVALFEKVLKKKNALPGH